MNQMKQKIYVSHGSVLKVSGNAAQMNASLKNMFVTTILYSLVANVEMVQMRQMNCVPHGSVLGDTGNVAVKGSKTHKEKIWGH